MQNKQNNTDKTILTIVIGFLIVFVVSQWNWALTVSLCVGLIGIFSTFLSQKIEWLWMQLTKVLSMIVPNIILAVVFYLILFPVAILSRILGKKDTMRLKGGSKTCYIELNKSFSKDDFTYPW
jgi:hypothetical protein